jgi:hypothetical protein
MKKTALSLIAPKLAAGLLVAGALTAGTAATAAASPAMNLTIPRVDQQQTRDARLSNVGYFQYRRVCRPVIAYRYGLYGWRPYVAGYRCFYRYHYGY